MQSFRSEQSIALLHLLAYDVTGHEVCVILLHSPSLQLHIQDHYTVLFPITNVIFEDVAHKDVPQGIHKISW